MTTLHIATPLGVIADTHGQLRPEALTVLADCEAIVHLGDVGAREEDRAILARLEDRARVFAVRGNIDTAGWAESLPAHLDLNVNGRRLHLVHDIADADAATAAEVILHGHSHKPRNEWRDGRLLFNPGAAGRRRFRLPICVGKLWLDASAVRGAIVHLPV
ncbi:MULTISPECIES: metallophosphoesterase family protein [unclassified Modicisalibacter]|uniref:metallophosphoesterase family protein n=1 Tax=unclassified Modicisalibacter TaxID=2679913 RepID=UPI001CCD54DF|nr:metallophosphoesterase family protein [Modicisalibacter sp. R2A 31.J]MBZ9577205.1 metallophosphoesterase family protein [Modicisalibacter sp. MOD 31.J]